VFSDLDVRFDCYREFSADWATEDEDALMGLAEAGASLAELLAACPDGVLSGARRVLTLYRRGALTPREKNGPVVGEMLRVPDLIARARALMAEGSFEAAAALAAEALERAAVPEAQALYREAESRLSESIAEELSRLEGTLSFEPLPRPPPPELTADDLYLYSRLKTAPSVRECLRTAAMGELGAYRALRRLFASGLVRSSRPDALGDAASSAA
jgi:hypothetical protein